MDKLNELIALAILLAVIGFVILRLPRVELGHSDAFRMRRLWNWLPLGLAYAFLYFGRYNLNAVKDVKQISGPDYGDIVAVGSLVYGLSFLLNGPLVDRFGGRFGILAATLGSGLMNVVMGVVAMRGGLKDGKLVYSVLYGANMYFQSFGAVAVVKVNSQWFHIRERGTFGGIFGILISLGLYFAYNWGNRIATATPSIEWVFFIPGAAILVFWVLSFLFVRDTPADAGHADFDCADASSGDDGPRLPVLEVARRIFTNPIMITIGVIEFCSGFLRNAIMHWYRDFAIATGTADGFASKNWGVLLCVAGILGGVFAGTISDRVFHSRRGPVASVLYAMMLGGALLMVALVGTPASVGWLLAFMSMAVIGVHGMLSGTASADFGGKKNAGVAVGVIDGLVYLGVAVQSRVLGYALPAKGTAPAADPANWRIWPVIMIPVALVGFVLALRVWNAKPQPKGSPKPAPAPEPAPAPVLESVAAEKKEPVA